MRVIFWLIAIIIVGSMVLLFGNNLRCVSQRQVDSCPRYCLSQSATCDQELYDDCQEKFNCQAPQLSDYQGWLEDFLATIK